MLLASIPFLLALRRRAKSNNSRPNKVKNPRIDPSVIPKMTLELRPESSSLLPAATTAASVIAEALASGIVREALELPVDKIFGIAKVDDLVLVEVGLADLVEPAVSVAEKAEGVNLLSDRTF